MSNPVLVIGGGLSGLAAAIRVARFSPHVLLLEKHSRLGGLNSYFYRNKTLFETGLHAITNFADPTEKKAPLNRLLRQLKIKRQQLSICEQQGSKIVFENNCTLQFSNDFQLLESEIADKFPHSIDNFKNLLQFLETFDPFQPKPFHSSRSFLQEKLQDPLLVDMLLCPLMYYGSSNQNDIDLSQFAIMFQAIFLEGMFRPDGTIKDLLDLLKNHLTELGGKIRLSSGVAEILTEGDRITGVLLESGEHIRSDHIVSTIGYDETLMLADSSHDADINCDFRMGFIESIYQLENTDENRKRFNDSTIIFYNRSDSFTYKNPVDFVDFASGVICFPANFTDLSSKDSFEIRSTHLANYRKWKQISYNPAHYLAEKENTLNSSRQVLESIIGSFSDNIIYTNNFTPITIQRYTSKFCGAIYGHPNKVKDGDIGYDNLFLAGTDQGFLGIVGSMLSGVSIVNQHVLPKL